MLSLASNIQYKLRDAKDIVEAVLKLLRRPGNNHQFLNMSPYQMADEIEKIAKSKGLL